MFGKILTVALTILLINLSAAGNARAGASQNTAAEAASKVKAEVFRLGAGARVEVKLADGTKLKGQVGEADEEGFMLLDSEGGRTHVAYERVASVKPFKKSNWKTFDAKGVATFAAVMGGVFLVAIWGVSQTR